jgi:pimeloyl-ACP methyl ester carboxylesterase
LADDRAGFGGSDDDPQTRSLQRFVADLATMLDRVGATAPVVLVGASLGGAILRQFAATHPRRVAGLVFVDAAVAEILPDWYVRRIRRTFALLAALSRVGLHAPLLRRILKAATDGPIPPADRALLIRDISSARGVRTGAREARDLNTWLPTLRRLQDTGLPDVPVTTLVGEQNYRLGSATLRAAIREVGQREMRAHRQGRFVAAAHSSHYIPAEEPELVAQEVMRIVRPLRPAPS